MIFQIGDVKQVRLKREMQGVTQSVAEFVQHGDQLPQTALISATANPHAPEIGQHFNIVITAINKASKFSVNSAGDDPIGTVEPIPLNCMFLSLD